MNLTDPIYLTQSLLKCPSVTPSDGGTLAMIQQWLTPLGFEATILNYENVKNIYLRIGKKSPHLCFLGHVDVVPTGPEERWTHPPFAGVIQDGYLHGRGAVDMKGGVGAFIAAAVRFLKETPTFDGSLSIVLTSDEEGPSLYGTKEVVKTFQKQGEKFDACIVGESTNPNKLGEMIKVGRRGSLNGIISLSGKMGHVAYPQNCQNPIPPLMNFLKAIESHTLDEGIEFFDPSNLEVTTIDVGNPAANVIPGQATARFNIRFNPSHSFESLKTWIEDQAKHHLKDISYELTCIDGAVPFLCSDQKLPAILRKSIKTVVGCEPKLSTTGGTSDARFMKDLCPVVEFGLVNDTAHQLNECANLEDLEKLCQIYHQFIGDFLKDWS